MKYVFGFTTGFAIAWWILLTDISNKPQAIEVYQGKTTLEYKIVDGVVVDSCVVFKNK